jgi:hypothetical protein
METDVYGLDVANYQEAIRLWEQDKEFGTTRHCKQDNERDALAPDGVVSCGNRTIAKNGSFRFAGTKWQNDLLKPLSGSRIHVTAGDYWLGYVTIHAIGPRRNIFLMNLGNPNAR